ncbi:MAG: hypothetical protein HGA54_02840 [Actinobacteria bacterium]|nr:hypothetical protein [Actinomycetota bacterium]
MSIKKLSKFASWSDSAMRFGVSGGCGTQDPKVSGGCGTSDPKVSGGCGTQDPK